MTPREPQTHVGLEGCIVRVMLACPSDVTEEVQAFFEAVRQWNEENAEEYKVALLPKHWTKHTHPRLGSRTQGVVNEQLTNEADILVAVLWTRLGTHTGIAESGTVEEIRAFLASRKPVKLYYSKVKVAPDSMSDDSFAREFQRLKVFREEHQNLGLHAEYAEIAEFREQLLRHLTQEIRQLRKDRRLPGPSTMPVGTPVRGGNNSLTTLRRTARRLRIEWDTERTSPAESYESGKQIMARLGSALATHLAELADFYGEEELGAFNTSLALAKEIAQSRPVLGPQFHGHFWRTGTRAFEELFNAIDRLLHVTPTT